MKLKMTQSTAISIDGRVKVFDMNQEVEVNDKLGKALVAANYAEEIKEKQKKKDAPKKADKKDEEK